MTKGTERRLDVKELRHKFRCYYLLILRTYWKRHTSKHYTWRYNTTSDILFSLHSGVASPGVCVVTASGVVGTVIDGVTSTESLRTQRDKVTAAAIAAPHSKRRRHVSVLRRNCWRDLDEIWYEASWRPGLTHWLLVIPEFPWENHFSSVAKIHVIFNFCALR